MFDLVEFLGIHLSLWWAADCRMGSMVPPGQRGAEPLDLAKVDEERAVRTVHSIKGIARVRRPPGSHPLKH